ncbi:hypothetical protein LCGC14_1691010 [marine sediment metagenome]|uniref:Uncharacterized protein n=1 Tax=marine sediment metagenome TaxID=412755 RepID=A0A0F9HL77_9ZZZZ
MAVKAQDITAATNHANVQNLRGWSVRGSSLIWRLRVLDGSGQILASVNGDDHQLYPDIIDAETGTFFEVVSGTLTEGVLYFT